MILLIVWLTVGISFVFLVIVGHVKRMLRAKKFNNHIEKVLLPIIKKMIEEDEKPTKKVTKKSHE